MYLKIWVFPFIILFLFSNVIAFPYTVMKIHGLAVVDGEYAEKGTQILAYFDDGTVCGKSVVDKTGYYSLTCNAEKSPRSKVHFRINYDKANGNVTFNDSENVKFDLIVGDEKKARKVMNTKVDEESANMKLFKLSLYLSLILLLTLTFFRFKRKKDLVILFLFLIPFAYAVPPVACEFYGTASINYSAAQTGIEVIAYDPNNVVCGNFTIVNPGFYGSMSCMGDDPSTPEDEGAEPGDVIHFKLENFTRLNLKGNPVWQPGQFVNINISYYIEYCGDGMCNSNETCTSCPEDCGECSTGTGEGNTTGGGSGSGGGGTNGGSTGGGSSGSSNSGGGGGGYHQGFKIPSFEQPEECKPDWFCTNWTICSPKNIQTRICVDNNNCGINDSKPNETKSCVYPGNCNDGIKNNGETNVDCGGPCPPCASCYDGIMNQGELGVDCGGPCEPCIETQPQLQKPANILGAVCGNGVCEKGEGCSCLKDCRSFPWEIIFLNLFLILLFFISTKIYLHYYYKKDLDSIDKFKKKFALNRTFLWYSLLNSLFSIEIAVYMFYTGSCWSLFMKYLWVNVFGLLVIPVITYFTLKVFEYNEKRKLKKMQKMITDYNEQVRSLVSIQRKQMPWLLNNYHKMLNEYKKTDSGFKVFEKYQDLDLLAGYLELLEKASKEVRYDKEVSGLIKKCDEIVKSLNDTNSFMSAMQSDAKLKELFDSMTFIFSQFKELFSLLSELENVSEEYKLGKEEKDIAPKVVLRKSL